MQISKYRGLILAVVFLALVWYFFSGPAIPQDPRYHQFADGRSILGIPNGLNVLSNIPFLLVGIAGWWAVLVSSRGPALRAESLMWPYLTLFLGSALIAFGSGYYHLAPDNQRLVWDRLPMTLAFMGLLCAVIGERVGRKPAQLLIIPLLLAGLASVVYWSATERVGHGDLRPYLLVQYGSLVFVLLLLVLYPTRWNHSGYLWAAVAFYAVAKIFDRTDHRVFGMVHVMSGHTFKHLAAAGGIALIVRMLQVRTPIRSARVGATPEDPTRTASLC